MAHEILVCALVKKRSRVCGPTLFKIKSKGTGVQLTPLNTITGEKDFAVGFYLGLRRQTTYMLGWLAVAVFTKDERRRFCRAIDRGNMATNPELTSQGDRLKNFHRLIEPVVAPWARNKTKKEVVDILLREEMAAAPV